MRKVLVLMSTRVKCAPVEGAATLFTPAFCEYLTRLHDQLDGRARELRAGRLAVLEQHKDRWGREWIMLANPTYGSFESAPFKHDFKVSDADKRRAKRDALEPWPGP